MPHLPDSSTAKDPVSSDSDSFSALERATLNRGLLVLAQNGEVDALMEALKTGTLPDLDAFKTSALMHTAESEHLVCMRALMEARPEVLNLKDANGSTALDLTLRYEHWAVAHYLLDQPGIEANPIAPNGERRTPLMVAAQANQLDLVNRLLPHGGVHRRNKRGETALMKAAQEGALNVLEVLLSLTDAQALLMTNQDGLSALHMAARSGHTTCVEALLRANPDPDFLNLIDSQDGSTALMLAIFGGREDPARFLLNQPAILATPTFSNFTPLMAAASCHLPSLVPALLPLSNVADEDDNAQNALMYAVQCGSTQALRALLEVSDASLVRFVNRNQVAALQMAAEYAQEDCLQALIEALVERWPAKDEATRRADAMAFGHAFGMCVTMNHWDCADRLAGFVPLEEAMKAAQEGGPRSLPRWRATQERAALAQAVEPPAMQSSMVDSTASTPPSPPATGRAASKRRI